MHHCQEVSMRMKGNVAMLSLALVLSACSKRQEPTAALSDDLKKDLAAAAASTKDLVAAPQNYQRMRFVSAIEQSVGSVAAKRSKPLRHSAHTAASVAPDPMAAMMSHTPMPVSTVSNSSGESAVAVTVRPAPEAANVPVGRTTEEGGGGLGALLGGIVSNVVIRGGRVGDGKCDPRTDARANGTIANRPDFSMPLPTGQPVFGRRR
jgi:hypothetical protein